MAASSSSSEITQEEFFAFHNIDRQLFSRLVLNLRREPSVAMQAAALWLWLERLNMAQYVVTILTYPDTVFEALIEETLLCLRAAESHEWFYTTDDVPMVQSIVGKHRDGVNLRFFHENRIIVLLGVGTIIQQICIRAFQDFIQFLMMCKPHLHEYPLESYASSVTHGRPNVGVIGDHGRGRGRGDHNLGDDLGGFVNYPSSLRVGDFSVPLKGHFDVSNHCSLQGSGGFSATNNGPMPPIKGVSNNSNYISETQTQGLQGDIIDQFIAQLRVSENSRISMVEEMQNIPSSERTIFLTFSKGYPISETELHEFFNRYFFSYSITYFES
ncbi:hypothetical protein BVRB_3g055700 [Beta vulgaris subsp. vulgaris]|uniref:Uncharacterized protein n=1 Tax=Beta vulgaris subsp. vulgaris TaxID=3555 RepID=A0A0J8CQM2_BETVV|nr:hypothetical protein BVRB_3g055700 [Beta vulgaris subsp. vulgaris]